MLLFMDVLTTFVLLWRDYSFELGSSICLLVNYESLFLYSS